jgi:hypothetical protein
MLNKEDINNISDLQIFYQILQDMKMLFYQPSKLWVARSNRAGITDRQP